jgi:Trk K+ transport system NAD-binding subunit
MLVVTIERDGRVITPQGETTIEPGDIVTLLSPDGIDTDVLEIFEGASKEEV